MHRAGSPRSAPTYIGLWPPRIGLRALPYQAAWPCAIPVPYLCQADLPALQRHLLTHYARRPPDHLLFEWFSGEREDTRALAAGRSYRIFRHNLFFHIGTKSTINQPSHRFIPGCYALLYDWLLPAEVFNEKDCPDDDVWPCKEASRLAPTYFTSPRIVWSADSFKTPTPLNPLPQPRAKPGESSFGLTAAAPELVAVATAGGAQPSPTRFVVARSARRPPTPRVASASAQ